MKYQLGFLLSLVLLLTAGCSSSKKKNIEGDSTQESATESKIPTSSSHDYITSVKMKVRAESGKVADCYTAAIQESEDLVGKIYFSWSILDDGSIEKLAVNKEKSTISDEGLENCMMDIFSKIKFDELRGKDIVHINYPFKFTGKKKRK